MIKGNLISIIVQQLDHKPCGGLNSTVSTKIEYMVYEVVYLGLKSARCFVTNGVTGRAVNRTKEFDCASCNIVEDLIYG